jgi:LPS export ABC transporter protein LptC
MHRSKQKIRHHEAYSRLGDSFFQYLCKSAVRVQGCSIIIQFLMPTKNNNIIFASTYRLILTRTVMAAFVLLFCACQNDVNEVVLFSKKNKIPAEQSTDLHIYYSVEGKVQYEFKFPKVNRFKEPESYLEAIGGFEIIVYDDSNRKETILTAEYGVNYEERNMMEARNHVVITKCQTGEVIETERLVWDKNKRLIYSTSQIKQTRPDGSVYLGTSFESDESLQKYTIRNPQIVIYADS